MPSYAGYTRTITVDGIPSRPGSVIRDLLELVNDSCDEHGYSCDCWESHTETARWPVPLLSIHDLNC